MNIKENMDIIQYIFNNKIGITLYTYFYKLTNYTH